MTDQALAELKRSLRQCYAASPEQASEAIEALLLQETEALTQSERLALLARLEGIFLPQATASAATGVDDRLPQLVTRLLGTHIPPTELSGPEFVNRLAQALDTIFTQLNELIGVINTALGGSSLGDETIRHIIGGSLEAHGETRSIEEYLGQIRQAFLMAQQASLEAAHTIAGFILSEFDPETMNPGGGVFKLGAMKKSEAFDLFVEKYQRVRKWFDSERFKLDFLRQFENQCRKR